MCKITRYLIGLLFLSQLLIAKEKKISAATVVKNTVAFAVYSDNTCFQKLKDSIHKARELWKLNKQKASLRLYLYVLEIAKKEKNKKIINEVLIKISRSQRDTLNMIANFNTLAGIQVQFKNCSKAIQYLETFKKSLNTHKKELTKNYKGDLLRNLAWTYNQLEDPIAYKYLMEANRFTENLKNLEFDAILDEIEAKHNVDTFKHRAEKRHLLEVAKKRHCQIWSVVLGILLVGVAISFWVYAIYANLKRENAQLESGKRELLKEREQMESETQIKILNATLDGKETQRKEIAAILHDNVSAILSAASLHLKASKNKIKGKKPIEFKKTQALISEASSKIRNLSHQLISTVLLKFGLRHTIHDLCHKYSNSEIKIKCRTENLSRYEQNFEIKINNILEELINNILKHSNAKTAMVEVLEDSQLQLHIKIQDDGDGFDTAKKFTGEGIGIQQIAARVKIMKGNFSIHSDINKGTNVTIQVPCIPKTNGTPEMHA
jgi:two-component system, NarL family, sensor kinase